LVTSASFNSFAKPYALSSSSSQYSSFASINELIEPTTNKLTNSSSMASFSFPFSQPAIPQSNNSRPIFGRLTNKSNVSDQKLNNPICFNSFGQDHYKSMPSNKRHNSFLMPEIASNQNTILNQIDALQQQFNMRKSTTFGDSMSQSQFNSSSDDSYDMFFGSSQFNAQRSEMHSSLFSIVSDKENQM